MLLRCSCIVLLLFSSQWYESTVIGVRPDAIQVHFNGKRRSSRARVDLIVSQVVASRCSASLFLTASLLCVVRVRLGRTLGRMDSTRFASLSSTWHTRTRHYSCGQLGARNDGTRQRGDLDGTRKHPSISSDASSCCISASRILVSLSLCTVPAASVLSGGKRSLVAPLWCCPCTPRGERRWRSLNREAVHHALL